MAVDVSSQNLPENSPSFNNLELLDMDKNDINADQLPSTSHNSLAYDENAWGTNEEYESIMNEPLHIEVEPPKINIEGHRIVEIGYLLQGTLYISEKHARSCTSGNLFIEKEIRHGLTSIIQYKCNLCDKIFQCATEKPTSPVTNKAAV